MISSNKFLNEVRLLHIIFINAHILPVVKSDCLRRCAVEPAREKLGEAFVDSRYTVWKFPTQVIA
jgi:hypothetical protein